MQNPRPPAVAPLPESPLYARTAHATGNFGRPLPSATLIGALS